MDVEEAIRKRRSIRKYKPRPVPDDTIKEIVKSGQQAPSGHNIQPWKFYIVKDNKPLQQQQVFMQDFVYQAPLIIICCTDSSLYSEQTGNVMAQKPVRAVRDLSIASSFMVLRATELGLGTCYIGALNRQKLRQILNIPENYIIGFALTIGYPDESPSPKPRKPLEEISF